MKRFFAVFALLMLFTFAFSSVACSTNHSTNTDVEDTNRAPSVYELYSNTGNFSFAKLKISSIYENEYYDEAYTQSGGLITNYLVVECIIEEDFYGVQESGKTIYMPIIISSTTITYQYDDAVKPTDRYEKSISNTYYDKSEITEWLTGYDCILAYFRTHESIQLKRKDDPAKEIVTFYNITDNCMQKYN